MLFLLTEYGGQIVSFKKFIQIQQFSRHSPVVCSKLLCIKIRMENKLTEISRNDLPRLKRLYNPNEPNHYSGYLTVDTYIRWFEQNPNDASINDQINFYCMNGDWSRGTFVVTVS